VSRLRTRAEDDDEEGEKRTICFCRVSRPSCRVVSMASCTSLACSGATGSSLSSVAVRHTRSTSRPMNSASLANCMPIAGTLASRRELCTAAVAR